MSDRITCKNCGHQFKGKYCNTCGEKVYREDARKLSHLGEEALHFITHFEGTFFTTLKALFTQPGRLSTDYCNGIRKKYFKPLPFFLMLVILYLIFPFFEGLNMRLEYYPKQRQFGAYTAQKIQEVITAKGLTETALAEKFHVKGEKVSKYLLVTIIPFSALVLYLLGFWKRRYFFDHIVFSAEINSFYLLWGFLLLPLLLSVISFITGLSSDVNEMIIGAVMYGVLSFYIAKAARRFYGFKWWQSLVFTLAFAFVHIFIVNILYKFLLFITVINQI
jgi:hypothetical protein